MAKLANPTQPGELQGDSQPENENDSSRDGVLVRTESQVMCRVHSVVLCILVGFEVCSLMIVLAYQGSQSLSS